MKSNDVLFFGTLSLLVIVVVFTAIDGISHMVSRWSSDEYSYGYFIVPLVAFFIWQKKHALAQVEIRFSWLGVVIVSVGLSILLFGELATLYIIVQYGFIITLHGIAMTMLGWAGYRVIAIPLMMLFLAVPLPEFLYNNLSGLLQLISSKIGVWLIRQFDISVYLEGNVIHLRSMKLQVVEACSGLRYLFPLMAIGFMVAYIYQASFWKKTVLFFSTIPITLLMNSFRIGMVGVTVEYWGQEMAEGVLHDFEGWVVFMASLSVLFAEMWVLNQIGTSRRSFSEAFFIDLPGPLSPGKQFKLPSISAPYVAALALVVCTAVLISILPNRKELIPDRQAFADYPTSLGEWQGRIGSIDAVTLAVLQLDDYIMADFYRPDTQPVNLYAAYYASQRKGASVHSPRTCIPGGGWEISSLSQHTVAGVVINGQPLRVNRVEIRKGAYRQLVYYWFQQRGRVITNEYLLKWYLFQDSITLGRTDGSLVRLTTPVPEGADIKEAETRLEDFARLSAGQLKAYIPN